MTFQTHELLALNLMALNPWKQVAQVRKVNLFHESRISEQIQFTMPKGMLKRNKNFQDGRGRDLDAFQFFLSPRDLTKKCCGCTRQLTISFSAQMTDQGTKSTKRPLILETSCRKHLFQGVWSGTNSMMSTLTAYLTPYSTLVHQGKGAKYPR